MSTAPGVCVLGWVKCREQIALLVILCIIMYVKKNFFFTKPIMVKCLNIGKNIGQPIYRSISNIYIYIYIYIYIHIHTVGQKSI